MGSKGRRKPTLHSLSRLPINIKSFFKELYGESDRASALISGAVISDKLHDLLSFYFVRLEEDDTNHLFHTPGAPLGGFASRTDVSFALGLISPEERLVASVIRRIRNVFAHSFAQIDFSHQLVISELSTIPPGENYPNLPDMTPKEFFIEVSLTFYLSLLDRSKYLANRKTAGLGGLGGARPIPIYVLAKVTSKTD